MDKFKIIKLWRKKLPVFDMLNLNISFHEAIKKTNPQTKIIRQDQVTKQNRVEYLSNLFKPDEPIDFLEFGVFDGTSLLGVASRNKNPESRFFGFDTFEGYPEDFDIHRIGSYNSPIPKTEDSRVQFVKGKFQDSLSDFLKDFKPKNRMIIHFDADLYSATLYVLVKLEPLFDKNSILTFDEFGSLDREFRAFKDFINSFYYDYNIIQHTPKFHRVSIILKKSEIHIN